MTMQHEIDLSHIPAPVRDLLKDDRYGVSFPDPSGCQMRFIERGEDLGGFYAYSHYGSIRKAVEAAVSRNQQLRIAFGRRGRHRQGPRKTQKPWSNTGKVGVSGSWLYDPRRDRWGFRYQVHWKRDGKPASKSFHLSAGFSADHQFHAFRTAMRFRQEWEQDLDAFDPAPFQLWRSRRLYYPDRPLLPEGFWEQGEAIAVPDAGTRHAC